MARATTGLSYLTFGFVLLGSFVFVIFVSVPQWASYKEANNKLTQSLQTEKNRQDFLNNLESRAQELEKYAEDAKVLGVAIPDKHEQSNLWVGIQNVAASSGVKIIEIGGSIKAPQTNSDNAAPNQGAPTANVGVKTNNLGLEKWDTSVRVNGTYSQIREFIKGLEESFILSDMQAIDVTPVGDKEAPADMLNAVLKVRTYVQQQEK